MTGLRFAPGYAPRVLGVPADEFTDQRVPLDAVWSTAPRCDRITDLARGEHDARTRLETLALDGPPEPDDDAALVDAGRDARARGRNSTRSRNASG